MKLEFYRQIFDKSSNLLAVCPVGVELFHDDRQTDGRTMDGRDESDSHFPQFGNAPKTFVQNYTLQSLWQNRQCLVCVQDCQIVVVVVVMITETMP